MIRWIFNQKWLIILAISLCTLTSTRADEELEIKIEQLDKAYQALTSEIYQAGIVKSIEINNLDLLAERFNQLKTQGQIVSANQLIYHNLQNFTRYPNHPAVIQFTDSLLMWNERHLAEKIYGLIQNSGDHSNLPYLNFTFAKHHARHRQWQAVNQLLEDIFTELSGDDVDYAFLLQGSAFQHLKQHRKSVESYNNIPLSSPYYIHAQLNTAIASIRQGWITEARSIIDKIIPISQNRQNSELTNRIYLVLGYALLQKEYYRDARKAFRGIGLDSEYTNRALMGISLTAISQGDYVGGLNAANLLKRKQGQDLSADEAYLVVPYIYEKLEQSLSIEGSLSESIDHYQTRLLQLSTLKHRLLDFDKLQLEEPSGDLVLDNIRFDFSQKFPRYLLTNRHNLSHLAVAISNADHHGKIEALSQQYDRLLTELVSTLIDQRIRFINSYLNQARYGLARHYDKQREPAQ